MTKEDIYVAGELLRLKRHPGSGVYFGDPKDCISTHGGSGYAIGSFWLNKDHIVCGICGVVTEAPSSYKSNPPAYISGNPPPQDNQVTEHKSFIRRIWSRIRN